MMKKIAYKNNKNITGQQLKLLRVKAGLSQDEVAARLQTLEINIDQQMISKIENNARIVTDYELICFCIVLETDLKEVISDFYDERRKEYRGNE